MADEIRSMLIQLQARPDDADLRRRTAEALDASGDHAEAVMVLAPLVNLTGHDETELPCLCKKCLPAAGPTADAAGMQFQRSFAVVDDRVLHFWMLAELAHDRANVRTSVTSALRARLDRSKR